MARSEPGLNIVGVGAQDSLSYANEFVSTFGVTSFPMTWDPSGGSWVDLGVISQPYWILYDANGDQVASRSGRVDMDTVRSVLS